MKYSVCLLIGALCDYKVKYSIQSNTVYSQIQHTIQIQYTVKYTVPYAVKFSIQSNTVYGQIQYAVKYRMQSNTVTVVFSFQG